MTAIRKILLLYWLLNCLSANGQNKFLSLAGNWAFKIDSANEGEKDTWYNKSASFFTDHIKLPGTMDDAGFGNPVNIQPELKRQVLLHLWRKVSYTGAAWYQKDVVIPSGWDNKHIELFLERVIWETKIWVDGKPVSEIGESLVAPHTFDLSSYLQPGRHIITIRIDNTRKYDISLGNANFAQAYTDDTQIIWNGVIGKIGFTIRDNVFFENVQVYPNQEEEQVKVLSVICNGLNKRVSSRLKLSVSIGGITYAGSDSVITLNPGMNEIITSLRMRAKLKNWDEFNPNLYQLNSVIETADKRDVSISTFGFREISNTSARLQVNNRPLFLRGTLECSIFPKEGHTPMEKAGWTRVFKIAKEYGLNHLRFHSWCPPEAAFEAADELGFYLQAELPVWSLKIGKDAAADGFLKAEADRMIKYYGNHPSFCFWSMGNELQGNMQWLADEVRLLKAKDNRRLYTTTTFTFEEGYGKSPQPEDDYFVTQYTKKGWVRGQGIFETEPPSFNKDYTVAVDSLKVPLIIHEAGQYAVYPNMAEIPKYTGVLKPVNFIAIQEDLRRKNLLSLANAYTKASGKLSLLLYKEEIERALKTKGVSGFQLLDLHDFPGQGTALVGILDAFWDSKGLITASDFRNFCSPVVPLIRYPKATYFNDEKFIASVEVANFGSVIINNPVISWTVANSANTVIVAGEFELSKIEIGNGISIGNINIPLKKIETAEKLTITVSIKNSTNSNSWNIWVYPKNNIGSTGNILFTTDPAEAIEALKNGMNVLLNPEIDKINGLEGKFTPVFWSPVHFPDQSGTMGLLCKAGHPALRDFPTDLYTDWQWWDLIRHSKTLIMDSLPDIDPIVRVIDNFFKNRKLAAIFEAKVDKGNLLVCSMDIHSNLDRRPEATQLKASLMAYVASAAFIPKTEITDRDLKSMLK